MILTYYVCTTKQIAMYIGILENLFFPNGMTFGGLIRMDKNEKIICLSCLSALIAASMSTKIYYDKKKEKKENEDNEIKSNFNEELNKVADRDKLIIGNTKTGKIPINLHKMLMANKGSIVFDDYNGEMYDMTCFGFVLAGPFLLLCFPLREVPLAFVVELVWWG